jgi:hypothetical protein
MRKRSSRDVNEMAFTVVQKVIDKQKPKKNPAAVALGKLGGKKGGPARAKLLSSTRRSEIARIAAQQRWASRPDAAEE